LHKGMLAMNSGHGCLRHGDECCWCGLLQLSSVVHC
jgi:hypothetical protein